MADDNRKHPDPSKGEWVEFYLERQQFMDPSKRYVVPVNVNGYEFTAEFGKRQKLPKDVVEVLRNAKSVIAGKAGGMSNAHAVDTARGGEGRAQTDILNGKTEYTYLNDYSVITEKELA